MYLWKFMVEERFFRNAANGELVGGYNFLWRFRHKAGFRQYLSEKWGLELSSEVMFHAGKNVNINRFDPTRVNTFQFPLLLFFYVKLKILDPINIFRAIRITGSLSIA